MKKTLPAKRREKESMRPEYRFEYSQAKPNRFASRIEQPVIAVVLDSDVAAVFKSSSKVNAQLRTAIAARQRRKPAAKPRTSRHRKAS